jgi:PAS domain S-box-containing protein
MAKITNCNLEATHLLGYTKNDLIDMSINNIMPKIYSDYHDGFI